METATEISNSLPRTKAFDSTFDLLRETYQFISNRCRELNSDIFRTRLMLSDAICMSGAEASELFYGGDKFTRTGAMPPTTFRLLQDKGSVQSLDGPPHRHRKQMFMTFMSPASIHAMGKIAEEEWRNAVREWPKEVNLFERVQEILCRAACRWAGVPLSESEAKDRAREFGAMIDGSGGIGLRVINGFRRRHRTEEWASGILRDLRSGDLKIPIESPAHVIAFHRDTEGKELTLEAATNELLNLIRPTVAVARFIIFAALALFEHPDKKPDTSDSQSLENFANEVRRFYPFFPLIGGRAKEEFMWRGVEFKKGQWILLDIYGTNRDARHWRHAEEFNPTRFQNWDGNPYTFIPQGGGIHHVSHRCPGEWLTNELIKTAVKMLSTELRYEVPMQDLRIDMARMPAIPRSRFVIRNASLVNA